MRHHLISRRVLAWVGAIVAWGTLAPLQPLHAQSVTLRAETPMVAPEWALLQRELLRSGSIAMERYAERYFDERGYLLADLRWGMNDGPDDAIENINRWPEMYALGGSARIRELTKKIYDGHVRQFSEARTEFVPFATDGMYFKEFPTHADWMHNAEGIQMFNNMGLMDPYESRVRAARPPLRRFLHERGPGCAQLRSGPQADPFDVEWEPGPTHAIHDGRGLGG